MSPSRKKRVVVIGGGAAGYFAAITCAESNPGIEVILLEATRQPLYKVGISGGGRCNVTHNCFDPEKLVEGYPRGHKELIGPFRQFQAKDTVHWFESHGVKLKAEEDGRMFPITDDSVTVIEALQKAATKSRVDQRQHTRVVAVTKAEIENGKSEFEVRLKSDEHILCDRVLLATGSSPAGYTISQSLGHAIVPCVPSLFTFNIKDQRLHGLSGISFENVQLQLRPNDKETLKQSGPLLITHWGLSGPAVIKLSAWGARQLFMSKYHAELTIDFAPTETINSVIEGFHRYRASHPTRMISAHNLHDLPKRYWERIVATCGIADETTWAHITKEQSSQLAAEIAQAKFQVTGKGEFKEEFVTCGGVKLKEVDFRTMESRICPGLYFAGELLDIDGITGGYNFQSAWTSGWIAGKNMAAKFD